MANNFKNAVIRNISADSNLPTTIYEAPNSKKSIAIELDCSNKSSSGVTVTVQMEDESQNESGGNAHTISAVATNTTGLLTTTSSAVHNLIVNDRVLFAVSSAPSFTDASLPPSAETALSVLRFYYVQSIPSTSTFTIAETRSGTLLTFDSNGSGVTFTKIHLADMVKDAPVPVGGALKVISGQKLVLESDSSGVNDKLYAYSSAASSIDVIASVLEDVS
tara:strand:- start:456 stop:1115 length:660 start_codon:yes stop_codon:yes gene_type:complete